MLFTIWTSTISTALNKRIPMEVKDAINQRKSVRGFLDKPIEKEVLQQVLALASRAVSAHNAQPWEVAVVTGEPLQAIREAGREAYLNGEEMDRAETVIPEAYLDRGRELGYELFRLMDIKRDDRDARRAWNSRGFGCFDAPAVIFLYMDDVLDETEFRFDMGCFAQNLCLAAMEYGLGTCVANQMINYSKKTYEVLNLPGNKKLVVGIAIGYENPDFPGNKIKSKRVPMEELTLWAGFDE